MLRDEFNKKFHSKYTEYCDLEKRVFAYKDWEPSLFSPEFLRKNENVKVLQRKQGKLENEMVALWEKHGENLTEDWRNTVVSLSGTYKDSPKNKTPKPETVMLRSEYTDYASVLSIWTFHWEDKIFQKKNRRWLRPFALYEKHSTSRDFIVETASSEVVVLLADSVAIGTLIFEIMERVGGEFIFDWTAQPFFSSKPVFSSNPDGSYRVQKGRDAKISYLRRVGGRDGVTIPKVDAKLMMRKAMDIIGNRWAQAIIIEPYSRWQHLIDLYKSQGFVEFTYPGSLPWLVALTSSYERVKNPTPEDVQNLYEKFKNLKILLLKGPKAYDPPEPQKRPTEQVVPQNEAKRRKMEQHLSSPTFTDRRLNPFIDMF